MTLRPLRETLLGKRRKMDRRIFCCGKRRGGKDGCSFVSNKRYGCRNVPYGNVAGEKNKRYGCRNVPYGVTLPEKKGNTKCGIEQSVPAQ